jgi:S1-C subfamily serine protease
MDEEKTISIIKQVMPAVVSIAISKHLKDVERDLPADIASSFPINPKTQKMEIPDEFVDSHGMVQIGSGSGFIVRENGLILTNKHVVEESDADYTIILNDGVRFPAKVLSRDPINDVALLKIEADGLPVIPLGSATNLELGQSVIAIGNALGIFKNTVSRGIISGLSRSISAKADPKAPPQELRGLIQTDAAINPGNSGGPLVDSKGKAVGINVAIISGAQNIGLAIPINAAERDLEDIEKFGRIRRPYLGLRYLILDENLKDKLHLPVDYGAYVTHEGTHDHGVIPQSPAARAGLKERDIVLEFNGVKIDSEHSVQDFLETLNVGDEIILKILRTGEHFDAKVILTERK